MKYRLLITLTVCAVFAAASAFAAAATPPANVKYATRAIDASRIAHRNFIGGINNRLTVVQEMAFENAEDASAPWETAVYEPVDRLWLGATSASAEQDDAGAGGYEFEAKGFNIGYDWSQGDLTVGVAAAFGLGTIQSTDIDTKNKLESVALAVYAGNDPLAGLFYDVNATYGMSWNRSLSWQVAEGPGSREGRFKATSFGLGGNIGYSFDFALAKVTPMFGLQWARHRQNGYTERANVVAPHWFGDAKNTVVDIPLAVRVGTSWQLGNGAVVSPEVSAAYILQAGDNESSVTVGTVGGSAQTVRGVEDGDGRTRFSAGVKANFNPSFDAFMDYSLELKSGYSSSNFNTGIGLSF